MTIINLYKYTFSVLLLYVESVFEISEKQTFKIFNSAIFIETILIIMTYFG